MLSTHTNISPMPPLSPQLSQAGDLIIEVYLEQKVSDCCVTLKVSPRAGLCRSTWGGSSWCPWDPSCTTHGSSPCVRPQVSPTMTAEELTNQVLEMRNVPASLDIWLTFEALENGELGERRGMAQGCSWHGQAGEGQAWGTASQNHLEKEPTNRKRVFAATVILAQLFILLAFSASELNTLLHRIRSPPNPHPHPHHTMREPTRTPKHWHLPPILPPISYTHQLTPTTNCYPAPAQSNWYTILPSTQTFTSYIKLLLTRPGRKPSSSISLHSSSPPIRPASVTA